MKLTYADLARVLAMVLCCAAGAAAQPAREARDDAINWLKIVPADAGFYVELRDLAGIRRQFIKLGIWRTVLELSERDAKQRSMRPGQRGRAELLGMHPETAISRVMGRRAALIASSSGGWREGVLIAELAQASDLLPLLRRWRARLQGGDVGPVRRYMLHGGMNLAVLDRTVVFGPAGDPEGLWGRTVLLLSGRGTQALRWRSEFAGLQSRLTRDYPSLVYVEWEEGDPTAVAGCRRLLIGISVEPDGISCELRGHRQAAGADARCLDASTIGALPADSLAVWSSGADFSKFAGGLKTGLGKDGDALAGLLLGGIVGAAGSVDLMKELGPGYVVVVGHDRSSEPGGPPPGRRLMLPAIGALIEVRGGEAHVERMDSVLGFMAQFLEVLATPDGKRSKLVEVARTPCEGVELHHVEIGPAVAQRTGLSFLKGLRPCWAVLDGRLVVSTSKGHVEAIVRAARGKAPRLDGVGEFEGVLPRKGEGEAIADWATVRGSAVSEMFSSWLWYLRRRHPEALSKQWWQAWAANRLERHTQLGVGLVRDETNPRRAVVLEVRAGSPASGILDVGDVIVGAAGKPLTSTQPALEVARRYRARGGAGGFALNVLRSGKGLALKILVPPATARDLSEFDPVLGLRQLMTLSRRAQTVAVTRYAAPPGQYDARIEIRWDREKPKGKR
jgi:hypothetical protein